MKEHIIYNYYSLYSWIAVHFRKHPSTSNDSHFIRFIFDMSLSLTAIPHFHVSPRSHFSTIRRVEDDRESPSRFDVQNPTDGTRVPTTSTTRSTSALSCPCVKFCLQGRADSTWIPNSHREGGLGWDTPPRRTSRRIRLEFLDFRSPEFRQEFRACPLSNPDRGYILTRPRFSNGQTDRRAASRCLSDRRTVHQTPIKTNFP